MQTDTARGDITHSHTQRYIYIYIYICHSFHLAKFTSILHIAARFEGGVKRRRTDELYVTRCTMGAAYQVIGPEMNHTALEA